MWLLGNDVVSRLEGDEVSFDAYYSLYDLISLCEGKFGMLWCYAIYGYKWCMINEILHWEVMIWYGYSLLRVVIV